MAECLMQNCRRKVPANRAMCPKHDYARKPVSVNQMAREDRCPHCGGELDTGFECNDCGFDALPLVHSR